MTQPCHFDRAKRVEKSFIGFLGYAPYGAPLGMTMRKGFLDYARNDEKHYSEKQKALLGMTKKQKTRL